MIIDLEFLSNPIIILTFLFAIIVILIVMNLSAKWADVKEKWRIPDIQIGNAQTIGNREKQEDSFATDIQEYGVFAMVADGIGSFINGRLASKLAVQSFIKEFRKADVSDNITYFFKRTAQAVNGELKALYGDVPAGTTMVAAVIRYNTLYYGWAGDSSIAIYRNGSLIPLNQKDNVENRLEDLFISGYVEREDVLQAPFKERLINYLGQDEFKGINVHEREVTLKKGDKVVLFSDGLETLNRLEIEGVLSMQKSPQETAEELIAAINDKEVTNKDNATVIVMHVNHEYKK